MSKLLPVTPEDKIWIDENFAWFFDQYGTNAFHEARLVLSLNDLLYLKNPQIQPSLEELLYELCQRLRIPRDKIHLDPINPETHSKFGMYLSTLGLYKGTLDFHNLDEQYYIGINTEANVELKEILGTLIHELCHIKLLGENRISPWDRPDQEFLTDLCTVFWGFGVLSANDSYSGAAEVYETYTFSNLTIKGYLPLELWAYALALYAMLVDEATITWVKKLSWELEPLFMNAFTYLNTSGNMPFTLDEFPEEGIAVDPLKRNLLSPEEKSNLAKYDHLLLAAPSSYNFLERAQENKRLRLYQPAAKDFYKALQLDSHNPDAYAGIAAIFLDLRDLDNAHSYLLKGMAHFPHSPSLKVTKAYYHLLRGELEQARISIEDITAQAKEYADVLHISGMIAYEERTLDLAFSYMHQAILKDPKNSHYFLTRGIMSLGEGRSSDAEADIDQAMKLNPKLHVPYTYKGILLRKSDQFEAALAMFEKALFINPYDSQASWHQELTYQRQEFQEGNEWVEVFFFSDLILSLPIRAELDEARIKYRIRDSEGINFTASTHIGKSLFIREEHVEMALDLLKSNLVGWETYAY